MITSIEKSAAVVSTSRASCATPVAAASSTIFSGMRRRSATTTHSTTDTAMIAAKDPCWCRAPWTLSAFAAESPRRTTAQKASTHIGCLRRKS
jgi:hypothetical protein